MILSLDLSTKSSGWAVLKETGVLWRYGCEKSSSSDLIKRIHIMIKKVDELLRTYDINVIIVEEVRPIGGYGVGNQDVHRALMWLQGALAILVHDRYPKIKIEYMQPSSWRAKLGIKNGRGIKRETLKESDIKYVRDNFTFGPDDTLNDDEADAICIGLAYLSDNKEDNEINWG